MASAGGVTRGVGGGLRCGRGLGGTEGVARAEGRGLSNVGAWPEPHLGGVARSEPKAALDERRGRGLD